MKFMILVKATQNSEAGVMPSEKLLAEMGRYNEELVKGASCSPGKGSIHLPETKELEIPRSGCQALSSRPGVTRSR